MTSDPDDNIFLECADASRTDYLITGNQRHFPAFWKQTKIITTREFITVVAPPSGPVKIGMPQMGNAKAALLSGNLP